MNLTLLAVAALSGLAAAGGAPSPWADLPLPGGARGLAAAAGLDPGHPAWAVPADIAIRLHTPEDPSAHALDRPRLAVYLAAMPAQSSSPDRAPLPLPEAVWRSAILPPETAARPLVAAILLDPASARLYRALMALDTPTLQFLAAQPALLQRLRVSSGALALFSEGLRVEGGVVATPGGPSAVSAWETLVGAPVARPADFLEKLSTLREGRLLALHHVLATVPAEESARVMRADAGPAAVAAALEDLARAFDAQPAWWLGRSLVSRPALTADEIVRLVAHARGGPEAAGLARSMAQAPPDEGRARFVAGWFAARVFGGRPQSEETVPAASLAMARRPALAFALERAGVGDPAVYAELSAAAAAAERRGDPVVVESLQAALAVMLARTRGPASPTAAEVAALSAAVADRDPVRALGRLAHAAWTRPSPAAPPPTLFTWEGVRYTIDAAEGEKRGAEAWREALGLDLAAALAAPPGDEATRRLARELRGLVYVVDAPASDTLLRGATGLVERHEVPAGDPWRLPAYAAEGAGGRVVGALLGLDVALSRFDLRRAGMLPTAPRLPPPARLAIGETLALIDREPDPGLPRAVREAVERGRARATGATGGEVDPVIAEAGLQGFRRGAYRWLSLRAAPGRDLVFTLHELAWLGGLRPDGFRGWGSPRGPAGSQGQPWYGPPPRFDLMARSLPTAARLVDPALAALLLVAERDLPSALAAPLLAHLVQWVIDEARPAHELDGPALARSLQRFGPAEQDDAVAALVDGVLVPLGTEVTPRGGTP